MLIFKGMGVRIWGSNLGKQSETLVRVLHKEYKMPANSAVSLEIIKMPVDM
jgi:hypothetical protein